MFKTGNISSDPDTSTHTPDFNSRTPPEVDQSLKLYQHAKEYSQIADFTQLDFELYSSYLMDLVQSSKITSIQHRNSLKAIEGLII